MNQTEINFTKPPLTPQSQRLYERLLSGPITNIEMRDELRLLSYTRRIYEVKKFVEPTRTIEKNYLHDGIFEYRIKGLAA